MIIDIKYIKGFIVHNQILTTMNIEFEKKLEEYIDITYNVSDDVLERLGSNKYEVLFKRIKKLEKDILGELTTQYSIKKNNKIYNFFKTGNSIRLDGKRGLVSYGEQRLEYEIKDEDENIESMKDDLEILIDELSNDETELSRKNDLKFRWNICKNILYPRNNDN